ncbi:MAG: hypothetical protein N4Q13_06445 [Lactobacillus crispatus]|uniref:hypothetical protein n=1 Tax=Lactobacillus crispatus TaxID=47770 RepID=UPI002A41B2C5|nr:hypothetical protein [Lactobacillus crispatus]MCT7807879.1 hypothetical protein [Lactobacillus crispatus]MCT7816407.1 hypothetical protein [Lactobacillus crispatus]MCT7869925.1 hypothetical protein [Lactobacillus crispatus]MCT7878361.1 hypothetical protein [Lactobacillus crispatus]
MLLKRCLTILVIISFVLAIVAIIIAVIIWRRHSQKQNFDLTPRDNAGDAIDTPEDEEDDPSSAPVYAGDFGFEDWQTWEDFLAEVGVLDIRNAMIEYETGDNSRMFIMLAEMQQSNPSLKTDQELNQDNALAEVFYNGVHRPLKFSSQSQKVEMTDFLNGLKDHSQYLRNSNPEMKKIARDVINDTLSYQHQTDRFENRCYLQFMAIVQPDEVYGDTPEVLEKQIHEKALEKLLRQIANADGILRRADHALNPLDTFGLLEVLYKTFNRESSVKMRFEDIIRRQRFSLYTSARQPDKLFKEVQQKIRIEAELMNHARDAMWLQQQAENEKELSKGKDYYSANGEAQKDTTIDKLNDETKDISPFNDSKDIFSQSNSISSANNTPKSNTDATVNSDNNASSDGIDITGLDDLK